MIRNCPVREAPRYSDVDDRTEEKEHDELGQLALQDNILQHVFPSPAAFGAAGRENLAQVLAASDAAPAFAAV